MIIREWTEEDLIKICELEKECFKDGWSLQNFKSAFKSPNFISALAEDEGRILGYGAITVAADSADIENIAVSAKFRRGGVGSKILQNILDAAKQKGANKVFLEVRVSNFQAMLMYLKHGFAGVYARTRYYPDGEDCLIMCKNLT